MYVLNALITSNLPYLENPRRRGLLHECPQSLFIFYNSFSLVQCKENELHRKYKIFGRSMENAKAPPILEIVQN